MYVHGYRWITLLFSRCALLPPFPFLSLCGGLPARAFAMCDGAGRAGGWSGWRDELAAGPGAISTAAAIGRAAACTCNTDVTASLLLDMLPPVLLLLLMLCLAVLLPCLQLRMQSALLRPLAADCQHLRTTRLVSYQQ